MRDRRQRVDLLLHLEHVQRGDTQDLGLAALEDRRTVHARDDLHLGVERTDVGQAAAVHADALGEDAAAHDLLGDRLVGGGELERRRRRGSSPASTLAAMARLDAVLERVVGVLTLDLVGDLVDALELVVGEAGDEVVGLLAVGQEDRELLDRLRGAARRATACASTSCLRNGFDGLEALGDDLLRSAWWRRALMRFQRALGGLGLDHHDRDVFVAVGIGDDAAGDDEVEHGLLELRDVRERDPLVGARRDRG